MRTSAARGPNIAGTMAGSSLVAGHGFRFACWVRGSLVTAVRESAPAVQPSPPVGMLWGLLPEPKWGSRRQNCLIILLLSF